MTALFKSPTLQKELEQNGFVKVPLLSKVEVAELMTAYQSVALEHEKINIPYITTSHSNNSNLITFVDNVLQKVMAPAINNYLINYNLLFGNYLIKIPGNASETSPHQDITFVDESKFTSVNIWVALQDTNRENGCMYFLKGSHNLMPTLRPTHSYPWPYEKVTDEIKQRVEAFPAKAGEAFIFNHAIIHGSYSNSSTQPRIAAVMAAYNKEAELLHYYLPEGEKNNLQKYKMTKDAFLYFVKSQPPAKGIFLKQTYFEFKQLSQKQFISLTKERKGISNLVNSVSEFFKRDEL